MNPCNPVACQNDTLANPIMINIGCVQREVKMHRDNNLLSFRSVCCALPLPNVEGDVKSRWRNLGEGPLVSRNSLIHCTMCFVNKCL